MGHSSLVGIFWGTVCLFLGTDVSDFELGLRQIRAQDLRGHVEVLASDGFGGRNTPSAGLNASADYLAQRFRRLGLQPLGGDSYFQSCPLTVWVESDAPHTLTLRHQRRTVTLKRPRFSVSRPPRSAVSIRAAPVILSTDGSLESHVLTGGDVIVALKSPPFDPSTWRPLLSHENVLALLVLDPEGRCSVGTGLDSSTNQKKPSKPIVFCSEQRVCAEFDGLSTGSIPDMWVSLELPAGRQSEQPAHNVVGLWPAHDGKVNPHFLLVTAHYDHVGSGQCDGVARGFMDPGDPRDWIWNGANDNASGVSSILEIAEAVSQSGKRFQHAIVFVAFCGEEIGFLGSSWFTDHPLVPLSRIAGQINLEQTGRTDDPYLPEGILKGTPSVTGYGYSTMTDAMKRAAADENTGLYEHPFLSDMLFLGSDNAPFALRGIPAHTACLAYQYADYHGAGDHADALNYPAMEAFTKMIFRTVWTLADDPNPPKWHQLPETKRFRQATP